MLRLDLAPAPTLQKQIDNHRAVQADNDERAENVPTVLLPHRRLPESNDTIRREPAFTNAPALKGAPVRPPAFRTPRHSPPIRRQRPCLKAYPS
jgi:hypothetical protein